MKAWLQPKSYERRYKRFLKKTIEQVRKEFLARLGHIAKAQKVARYDPIEDDTDFDDPLPPNRASDDTNVLIAGLLAWWLTQLPAVRNTIRGYYHAINLYNDKQFISVVLDQVGVHLPATQSAPYTGQLVTPLNDLLNRLGDKADVYRQEPYLDPIEDNWTQTQETYIDKAVNQAVSDSELVLRNGLVTSVAATVVLGAIAGKFNITEKRAEAFAVDQVNSLDTQLAEMRQRSLGIDEYLWQTRRDERVRGDPSGLYPNARPSHYARDGQIFNWKNPPEGGHPGEAPGCRCRAIMRLPR